MALSSSRLGAALGKPVRLTVRGGAFQGVLQYLSPDRRLLLRTVKNLETGRSTPGVKLFFEHEIVSVEVLDELDSGNGAAVLSECASAAEGNGNKGADAGQADCSPWSSPAVFPESQPRALNSLKYSLSEKEEEKVEYTVIDCFQQKFGPAVLHLKQQRVVSVVGEGVNLCRHGKLSWLQIATKSRIFLFDIFLLGPQAFKNGLQMVLEDKNILKVIHDCRWISDCLFHQYSVLLCNVFDTQVADVLQFSMATGGYFPHRVCTLQECLMQHLKIPSKWDALMKCRQEVASENPDIWFLRPFPPSLLQVLALKAMYLLMVHSSLMDNLMSDLTAVVNDYLNAYRNGSGDHLRSTKQKRCWTPGVQQFGTMSLSLSWSQPPAAAESLCLMTVLQASSDAVRTLLQEKQWISLDSEPTCRELPKELRQLAGDQKLRREKAVKDYRMNEDGLLIRPAMKINEQNDPQKDGAHRDDRDCLSPNEAMSRTSFNNQDLLCQEKHENQNQVARLWENLKPTSD